MLNSIRNFSKTIYAKILLFIVVIPFVFWGMGGVFNSGNTNSLVKINEENVSTQDFIKHITEQKFNQEVIRENIDNNIVEELLSELISKKILEMQIEELNINISEKNLVNIIKKNPNFIDDNNNFSRLKYEKFLLSNNIDAPTFERRLKDRELQKNLFSYISGGVYSPSFLTKKTYEDETKKIEVKYVDLKEFYGSETEFTKEEINQYIENNKEKLEQNYLNYSYVKLIPDILTGTDQFNQVFFDKIDEIENKILTGSKLDQIIGEYDLKKIDKKNISKIDNLSKIDRKILDNMEKNPIDIIDMNEFYLLYEINSKIKKLPNVNNDKFIQNIKNKIYQEKKYSYNLNLIKKISSNNFNDNDFNQIINSDQSKVKKLILNSSKDNKTFNIDSVKIIYSIPVKNFTLASDEKNNVYLIKVMSEIVDKSLAANEKIQNYKNLSTNNLNQEVLTSYDFYLNQKYNIKINEQTLERVKNYFR